MYSPWDHKELDTTSDVHFFTSSTKYDYKYFKFINATSSSPMHYKVDILIYPYFASELTDAKRD